jgi:co-chaperonin GroES (HSP10)
MKKMHPAGHRVLVKLKPTTKKEEEVTESGIIIERKINVAAHQRAEQEAIIIEVGPNAWKDFSGGEPWAKVGDTILISKYSGEDKDDLEEGSIFRIINDEDVLAIIEEV